MFGDPRINQKGLKTSPLGKLIQLKSGEFLPASQMNQQGEHLVYGGNGVSGHHDEYLFEEPKIVIGRVGVYCGAVHVTAPKSWITDNALYVSEIDKSLSQKYLEWALRIANLNQCASQAAQPLISGGRIYPVEILVPEIATQDRFEKVVRRFTSTKEGLGKLSVTTERLFGSISQRAFKGEI